jgi:hypothetical protein
MRQMATSGTNRCYFNAYLIALYVGQSDVASWFGAAGARIVLLVWIFHSSLEPALQVAPSAKATDSRLANK